MDNDDQRLQAPVPSVCFDSAGLSETEAFEAYAGLLGVAFAISEPGPGYSARITTWRLGPVILHDTDVGAMTIRRPPARIAADGLGHLMFQVILDGQVECDFDGRPQTGETGDILCLDLARPLYKTTSRLKTITVGLARPDHGILAHISRRLHGAKLTGEPARLLRDYCLNLRDSLPRVNAGAAGYLGETTRNLLGAAFAQVEGAEDGDSPALARVQAVLRERLGDRSLTPEQLAADAGMSRAALYRLFAARGGVSKYLWRQRLIAARRSLGRSGDDRTIAEIAAEWGFASESHFSRAFRDFFGETPSQARRRLAQPLSGVIDCSSPEFLNWVRELG